MAAELEPLIAQYLTRLPTTHPDRRFLEGLQETVAGYIEQTGQAAPVAAPEGDGLPPALPPPTPPEFVPVAAVPRPRGDQPADTASRSQPDVATVTEATPERHERRTVRGRVAATPDFKTLPKGSRRGHFPLAEHPDGETTVFWDVYTWNKPGKPWTDRLAELHLKRGDYAEVIGFVHPVTTTTRDGKPKPALLYAAAPIKTR